MDGEVWHEQRRFTLRHLRDSGFGRRFDILEKEIEIQISQFIDLVKNGPKYPHEEVMFQQCVRLNAIKLNWFLCCYRNSIKVE